MILCKEIVLESVSTFWAMRLFLFAVIVFCSWGITYKNRGNNYYWYYALPIIIFYILIQGLRYDRGVDYPHYAEELKDDIYNGTDLTREFLYDVFVITVRNFKIPFYFAFMFYSGLLISGLMLLVKHFRKYAFWIVPIFYLLTLSASENLIRQFIAISFIYFAYAYSLDKKTNKMILMLAMIPLIHFSGLFVVAVFLLLRYVDFTRWIKSPIPFLLFFIILTLSWNIAGLDRFADILSSNSEVFADTNFAGYVDNADHWFTEEGELSSEGPSVLKQFTDFICNTVIIWFGFGVCRRDKRFAIAYYGSYIAIIIGVIGSSVELINRMAWWLYPLEPIIIGGMLVPEKKYTIKDWLLIGIFVLSYYVRFFMQVGKPGLFGCAFVWDIV